MMNPTPETVAAALIDDEVLAHGVVAYNETPAELDERDLCRNVFVAMMAVLIRRENA